MTAYFPQSTPGEGATTVLFTPTLADPDAPTATVLAGATTLDLSCFIVAGGFSIESSQTTIEDRRLCSTVTYGQPGRVTNAFGDMTYVYSPQASDGDPDNEAYETLTPNTEGFLVIRFGLPVTTVIAADDVVDVYPIKWGDQRKNLPADEEGAILTATSLPIITGPPSKDVTVV